MSCQIEPGWRGATMADVHWIKDGVPISELGNESIRDELLVNGPTLQIQYGRHHAEGDYQCSAVIRGVRLSNGKYIDTRLVSAPVKFRRARITKFEKVLPQNVVVFQGQIARLPCSGMPDVIPGPPEIMFQRENHGELLGLLGDERYLSTPSGLQIPLAKISDSGNYYCIVRNTFTNQTRKSPYLYFRLQVLAKKYNSIEPVLVYPILASSASDPIVVDVVKGKTVLLECIVTSSKIMWTKLYSEEKELSVSGEKTRFRQIWGNLQIHQVNEADTGVYMCESMALFSHVVDEFPKIYYNLRVHAPTDVQLMLGQLAADRSWKLSCLALNLHYEIPMVYINGLALIDAMDQLGVPPHTNFFTNPINATLTSSVALSGSVQASTYLQIQMHIIISLIIISNVLQCISRPAMDEAEIYGNGLERGRAMNLFVDNRVNQQINLILQGPENSTKIVGETVQLVCLVVPRTTKTIWTKDGQRMALIGKKRVRLVGTASLQISDVQQEDEGWYTCEVTDNTNHMTRSSAYLKIIRNFFFKCEKKSKKLEPTNKDSDQLSMDAPRAFIYGRNIRIFWSLPKNHPSINKIASFRIEFRPENNEEWITGDLVDGHVRAVTIKALLPRIRYQFRVLMRMLDDSIILSPPTNWLTIQKASENDINPQLNITHFSQHTDSILQLHWNYTAPEYMDLPETFLISYANTSEIHYTHTLRLNNTFFMANLSDLPPSTEYRAIVEAEFADHTRIRSDPAIAHTLAAHGKFMDTSHRIFSEQRVQKSHLFYEPALSAVSDEGECTPLRIKHYNDRSPSIESLKSFSFSKKYNILPNLYGDEDCVMETSGVTSFKEDQSFFGMYGNMVSENSNIQKPLSKAVRVTNQDESFWLKSKFCI
ncbi:unnamed protein product [Thelazia callipaeda]|uniref:Ig-like domain-containing protein n=1 Tax=Thelazia callipaeda TaxID=103827 RepID=A0A0N5CK42_THECL|nr:unnamed protein product [Thelazia callipaeda]